MNAYSKVKEQLNSFLVTAKTEESSEHVSQMKLDRIRIKLENGSELSAKELDYLKKYDSALYSKALMMKQKREMLKAKLEHCNSKEEVEQIRDTELSFVSKKDPDAMMKINTITNTVDKFCKTIQYKNLPQTTKEDQKKDSISGVHYEMKLGSYGITYIDEDTYEQDKDRSRR